VLFWPINIWAEVASFSPVVSLRCAGLLVYSPCGLPASAVPRRSPPRREAMGAAVAGWTVAAVLLQVAGLSLFLYGFFPVKPTLRGFSGPESYRMPSCGPVSAGEQEPALPPDQLRSLYRELAEMPPVYDRLVLMVIDGLPAEFVLGKGGKPPSKELMESMPYTQSLLAGCQAAGYHAKAAPPTVTMPRLKAMVSGAIGGFLDVAFNFNTQAFLEDNLLASYDWS